MDIVLHRQRKRWDLPHNTERFEMDQVFTRRVMGCETDSDCDLTVRFRI